MFFHVGNLVGMGDRGGSRDPPSSTLKRLLSWRYRGEEEGRLDQESNQEAWITQGVPGSEEG